MKSTKKTDPESDFRNFAKESLRLILESDVKASNRFADKIIGAAKRIAASPETAEMTFRRLANDPVPEVASSGATYLLHYSPDEAKEILHRIQKMDAPWQISAHIEINLSRWEEGSLDLSWLTDVEKKQKN